jgi:outer membrane protein assembly factor BamB
VEAIDSAGKQLWKAELPGYVHVHPNVLGNLAILQTRGDSYGGQATVGIDTRDGKILWRDVTNAYGVGTAFGAGGEVLIEANMDMNPKMTNGLLICREATTGKRRWDLRRDGLIYHSPIADTTGEQFFAVFSRGEVIGMNARDGRLTWETLLPENALNGVAYAYDPAWSPHTLERNHLLVVDSNRVLHALAPATGKIEASILLGLSPDEALIAAPWIANDLLIVPGARGVKAFKCPVEFR